MSAFRVAVAFIVAPAVPSLCVGGYFWWQTRAYAIPFTISQVLDPASTEMSYAVAAVFGLPTFLLCRQYLRLSWWRYAVAGLLLACIPAAAFQIYEVAIGLGLGYGPWAFVIAVLYGSTAGLAFWAIGIAKPEGANAV